ncbi:MAG: hypothetical protein E7015_02065 [Alphaproteobacteria bacterium]|nr:hypothetical protein [Alphaproteobacteria bacterium]
MRTFFIAIISFVAGISECTDYVVAPPQTVFDLPDNTPGLMQDKQNKSVCGQTKECVHIVVPATNAERALKRKDYNDLIEAMTTDGNIYFPSDGTQPTTKEAGQYSCANVDAYNKDSPITEWYMKMFGVIDKNSGTSSNEGDYVKAGYAFKIRGGSLLKNISPNDKFINFLVDNCDKCNQYSQHVRIINFENDWALTGSFKEAFIKIASDPVGRVLLYRLLIEIRRISVSQHGTYGDIECDLLNLAEVNRLNLIRRNFCRSINVDEGSFDFVQSARIIHFSTKPVKLHILSMNKDCSKVVTRGRNAPADICLIHEMIHWFQFLRNIYRTDREYDIANKDHFISSCYGEDEAVKSWGGSLSLTEMRTILGGPNYQNEKIRQLINKSTFHSDSNAANNRILVNGQYILKEGKYLEGDDISENAYRMSQSINPSLSVSYSIRWGHTSYDIPETPISDKYQLANVIARFCCSDICNDKSILDKWCIITTDRKRGTAVSDTR